MRRNGSRGDRPVAQRDLNETTVVQSVLDLTVCETDLYLAYPRNIC